MKKEGFSYIIISIVMSMFLVGTVFIFTKYKKQNGWPEDQLSAVIASNYSEQPLCYSEIQISALIEDKAKLNSVIATIPAQTKKYEQQLTPLKNELQSINNKIKKIDETYEVSASKYNDAIAKQKALIETLEQKIKATKIPKDKTLFTKQIATANSIILKTQAALDSINTTRTKLQTSKEKLEPQVTAISEIYERYNSGREAAQLKLKIDDIDNLIKKFKSYPLCPKTESLAKCSDGLDNDRDGLIDCLDVNDCKLLAKCNLTPITPIGGGQQEQNPSDPNEIGTCSDGVSTTKNQCESPIYSYSCSNGVFFDKVSCDESGGSWIQEVIGTNGTWLTGSSKKEPWCGNNKRESGEECDGDVTNGSCSNCIVSCNPGFSRYNPIFDFSDKVFCTSYIINKDPCGIETGTCTPGISKFDYGYRSRKEAGVMYWACIVDDDGSRHICSESAR